MKDIKGKLIVIEGLDGSFKNTNAKRLFKYIKDNINPNCIMIAFPVYNDISSRLVTKYLKGEFGSINDIDPHTISLFYATDRYEACIKYQFKELLEKGYTIILDRYVGSNILYQSIKYNNVQEKIDYIKWCLQLEFKYNDLPYPDLTLYMRNDVKINLDDRIGKEGVQNDLHESNISYLEKVKAGSQFIIDRLDWKVIQCNDKDIVLSEDAIFEKIKNVIFN